MGVASLLLNVIILSYNQSLMHHYNPCEFDVTSLSFLRKSSPAMHSLDKRTVHMSTEAALQQPELGGKVQMRLA